MGPRGGSFSSHTDAMPRPTVQLSGRADTNEADLTLTGRADLTKSTITRERVAPGERNNENTKHTALWTKEGGEERVSV